MNQESNIFLTAIAEGRADRLRRLRNLANLSRKELCDGADININTYIGYEVSRYGGLTKKGAEKVIHYISTKGVYSSLEWLMEGIGSSPYVITDVDFKDMAQEGSEEKNINEEIVFFHHHYRNAIHCRVEDNGMLPMYNKGDYVAGISCENDSIAKLVGYDCIVKTIEGKLLVRKLCKSNKRII